MARAILNAGETGGVLRGKINSNFEELYNNGAYGIRYVLSTDTITRIGNSLGKVANANGGTNDFDTILPWAGMRRCNIDNDLNVLAYYGDAGYIEDGTNGQCMVEVPAFYYKRSYVDADTIDSYISMLPLEGYELHPWFYDENGDEVYKKYISTYEGSIYDTSGSLHFLADEQTTDFTAITGDVLSSIAGAKPASGAVQNLNIVNSRILATNRGAKWQQLYFSAVSAIQMLLSIEYASFNSQTRVGRGVVDIVDDGFTNQALVTGGTTTLGNVSGKATGTDGLVSISYRGIENFWGNINNLVDGININDSIAYISRINTSFVSNVFSGNYEGKATLSSSNGFFSKSALDYNFDYGFLPIIATGSSTTRYCDVFDQNSSGSFVCRFGGRANSSVNGGCFYWNNQMTSTATTRAVNPRLCI